MEAQQSADCGIIVMQYWLCHAFAKQCKVSGGEDARLRLAAVFLTKDCDLMFASVVPDVIKQRVLEYWRLPRASASNDAIVQNGESMWIEGINLTPACMWRLQPAHNEVHAGLIEDASPDFLATANKEAHDGFTKDDALAWCMALLAPVSLNTFWVDSFFVPNLLKDSYAGSAFAKCSKFFNAFDPRVHTIIMVPVNVLQPYQHWYAYKISITNKTDEGLRFEFELVDGALSLTMSPPRGIMAQMINDFLHFKFDMGGASAIASKSPIIGLLATSNFAHEDGNVWNICEYASNKKGGANFVATINGLIINKCASFSLSTRCCQGETVQLDKLILLGRFRFKGLGPKLMKLIMSLYRDAGALQIEIGAPNVAGTRCYKKCGFTSTAGLNLRSDLTGIKSNATLRYVQPLPDLTELNTKAIKSISSSCQTYLNSTLRQEGADRIVCVDFDAAPTESPWWSHPECVQAIPELSAFVLSTRESLQAFYRSNPDLIPLAAAVANVYELPSSEHAQMWFVDHTTEHEGASPRAICSKLDGEALSVLFKFPLVIIFNQGEDQVFGSTLQSVLPAVIYHSWTATDSSYQAAFPLVKPYAPQYEAALRMVFHHPRKVQFGESTDLIALAVFPSQSGPDSILFACCLHKMCRTKKFQPSAEEMKECVFRRLIEIPSQLQISVVKLERFTDQLLSREEMKLLGKEGSVTASVKRHMAFELHQSAGDPGSTCLSHGSGATIDVLSHSLVSSKGRAIGLYSEKQKHNKLLHMHQKLIESNAWRGNVATLCHELTNADDLQGVNHVSLYDGARMLHVDTNSLMKLDMQHVQLIALLMSTSSISAITTSSVTDWETMHSYAAINSTIALFMYDFFAVQFGTQHKRQFHTMWVRKPSRCQQGRPSSTRDQYSLVENLIHAANYETQRAQVTDAGSFIRSFCTMFPGSDQHATLVNVAVKGTVGSGRSGSRNINLLLGCTVTDTLTGRILQPGQLVQLEFSGTYSWGVFVGICPDPFEPNEDKLVLRFEEKEDIPNSHCIHYSLVVAHERQTSKFSHAKPMNLSLCDLLQNQYHSCTLYDDFRRSSSRLKGSTPVDPASTSSSSSPAASTTSSSSSSAAIVSSRSPTASTTSSSSSSASTSPPGSSADSTTSSSSSAASTPLPTTSTKQIRKAGKAASAAKHTVEDSEPELESASTDFGQSGRKRKLTSPLHLSNSAKKRRRNKLQRDRRRRGLEESTDFDDNETVNLQALRSLLDDLQQSSGALLGDVLNAVAKVKEDVGTAITGHTETSNSLKATMAHMPSGVALSESFKDYG